jgi:hypothetical protein
MINFKIEYDIVNTKSVISRAAPQTTVKITIKPQILSESIIHYC